MPDQRTVLLIAQLRDNMTPGLKKLATGARDTGTAIVALAGTAFAATRALGEFGASVYDGASRTGLSIEAYQRLGYAFEQTGGSAQSVETSIRMMTLALRTGSAAGSEQRRALEALGLSYDEVWAMDPESKFMAITDALGKMTAGTGRDVIGMALLGEQFSSTFAVLDQAGGSFRGLTDQFDEFGLALSDQHITALKEFDSAMLDVNKEMKVLQAEALTPLIPVLLEGIGTLKELAEEIMPDLSVAMSGATQILSFLLTAVKDGIGFFGGLRTTLMLVTGAYIALKIAKLADMAVNAGLTSSTLAVAAAKAVLAGAAQNAAKSLGPAGLGIAIAFTADQLIRLKGAMDDATRAVEEEDAAVNRLSDAQYYAGDAVNAVMQAERRGLEVSEQALRVYLERLRAIDDGSAEVATAIDFVTRRLGEQAGQTSMLSQAWEGLGNFLTTVTDFAAENAEDIEPPGFGSVESGKEASARIKQDLKAILAEAQRIENERQNKEFERIDAVHQAEMEALAAASEAERAAAEARHEAERQRIVMIQQGTASLFSGITQAAIQGKDALEAWFATFKQRLMEVAISSGFQALLGLLSPGGFAGNIFGALFGRSGGGIQPASGGRVVGGSPGLQGDRVLTLTEPGEEIVSRQERRNRAEREGGGGNTYIVNYRPLISTASRAESARAGRDIIDILRREGVVIQR